jgi:predicted ATPase
MRPEFTPQWSGQPHVSTLILTRLGRRDGASMVELVVGSKTLPAEVSAQIVAKTDGVPLFVEELTKAVLESGLLSDAGDRYELAGPLPPLAIPAPLQESLLARLDRLALVKEVAQIGAVIGREFSHGLLAAVSSLPEEQLYDALDQLVTTELVFRRGTPPDATYTFKHALVQDAAYSTLLKSRRQQLHARVTEGLEGRFPEVADTQPEVLAQHCTAAGLIEKAVGYWHKAGQLAINRSAVAEGAAQLRKGLDVLQALPDSAERRRRELGLQIALGNALTATKGWAAPEVGDAYARARELCRQEADATQLSRALWGLYAYNLHSGNTRIAGEAAKEMLRLGEQGQDPAAQVAGHRALGGGLMWRGQLITALSHLERALSLYDQADRRVLALHGVSDARVLCLGFTACILSWQGRLDQALVRSEESLAAAHESGQAYTLSHGLFLNCWFHQIRGEPPTVRGQSAALIALTAEHGFRGWLAEATFYHGWALAADGEVSRGIALMHDGLAAIRGAGMEMEVRMYLCLLGGMYTKAGQPTEALELLAQALGQSDNGEQRWFEAELHRLRGEALLCLSPDRAAEAEACYQQALAVAGERSARLWELRAATSLARLWRDQGERAEARDLLAPVYGWFTEGFETADLKDAKALLDELA